MTGRQFRRTSGSASGFRRSLRSIWATHSRTLRNWFPRLDAVTIQRMDNVSIVVEDLAAAVAFFLELGMELEGRTTVEGEWVDRIVGLDGVRAEIAMMRTPDGNSKLELTRFQNPPAVRPAPNPTVNTLGI